VIVQPSAARPAPLFGPAIAAPAAVQQRSAAVPLAILAIAILFVYWTVLAGLLTQWATEDNYTHGFLIPPLAAYFVWRRRDRLRAAGGQPSGLGLVVVLAALCSFAAGIAAAELFVTRVSLVLLVAGSVLFLYGPACLRVLAFPLGFLFLMIPLPAVVFNQIALPLQLFASELGEIALRAGHVAVLRDGNVLELVGMRLEVAQACSGIRSIMGLLAFSLVIGEIGGCASPRLVALAIATVPIAILANSARVVATGFAAQAWGPAVAAGLLHTAAGILVFFGAVLLLSALERATRPRWTLTEPI